jgi:Cu/Ag efflux pump CusA
MGVPGVAQVSIWGQRERQLQVLVDPKRLGEERITLQQIIQTAGNALWVSPLTFLHASVPGTGGWIETPNQRLGVQHLLPISTAEDLAQVTVEGTTSLLGDVVTVVEDHQPLIGDAVIADEPALMLVVEKLPWANTVEVTHAVEKAVASLELGLPGVEMDTSVFRPATYLEAATGNVSTSLLLGAALLVLALFGALYNWRTALIAFSAVALSALAAMAVLYLQEVTLNALIIAGLMVALVAWVDDAIIDIQNITRRLRQAGDGDESSRAKAIFGAALEMRRPVVYATVIVALAVGPFLLLDGMSGAFSKAIVYPYLLALLASIATALVVTPALSVLLLGDAASTSGESPLLSGLQRSYDGILSRVATAPGTPVVAGVAAVALLVVGCFWAMPKGIVSMLPTFKERDILITLDGAPGTSEHAMRSIATRVSSEVRSLPGVRAASAHVGRAVLSDTVADINGGEVWVSMSPSADWDATLASIRGAVRDYPGFDIDVETFLSERLQDEATGNNGDLVVRVYGNASPKLRAKADEVKDALTGIAGVVEAQVEYPEEHPTLEIETDLEKAKRWGLKPGDIRRAAATLLGGLQVGNLFEDQKVFDVVVWGTPELRHSLASVDDLLIDTPGGPQVRLGDVADTRIAASATVINREAVARYIDVDLDVEGRSLGAVVAEANKRIRENVDFPLEYRAEILGAQMKALEASRRVQAVAVAAALGILLLLQAAFGSWRLAGLVFLSLPVALLGGVATASAFVGLSSLGALLGFVAVFALTVRNAITLVSHYRGLEREGGGFSEELVLRGTRERFAPIVATTVAAALAFLPFALFGNIAGHEILQPMAIVVLGGLVTAMIVNLLVVPSLYLRFGESAEAPAILDEEAA